MNLGTIATAIRGTLHGDASLEIERVRSIENAGPNAIGVARDSRYFARVDDVAAAAVVVPEGVSFSRSNVIVVPDVKRAFIDLLRLFASGSDRAAGIHPRAVVDPAATLGSEVSVGACAVIERGAVLGDRVTVGANCFIGEGAVLGDDTTLHPNVTVYAHSILGSRVTVHAGTVIGSDGFGYEERPDGSREKIPQLGSVEIGDDVEIGANCAIDRATLEKTVIGRGAKIDNLVQIGHNSRIGEHVCIVGQAGVAGSATIGAYAILSGQAGIADHVKVGERVIIGAQAGVHTDIPSGAWLGAPAMPIERAGRVFAAQRQLPEYRERVRTLEDALAALEKRLAELEALAHD